MSKMRASVFEESVKLDVSSFAPKNAIDNTAPPAEQVREVAQAAHFRSREPAAPKPEAKSRRAPRQYRTGRNVQVNIKALQATLDKFYAITDAQNWVLGYTFQRAVDALERELKKPT